MIFSRLRRAKILHCIREYLSDNFHFSGNYHSKPRTDTPFKLFHSPAFAPPAELKQASKMLGWEIPSPLEENPTHTYGVEMTAFMSAGVLPDDTYLKIDSSELDDRTLDVRCMMSRFSLLAGLA